MGYLRSLTAAFFFVLLSCLPAGAQEHHHAEMSTDGKLGSVSFPTSCSAGVKTQFERGVALLHSFGYDPAHKQFQKIEREDPSCAMAYWGDAMSFYHQLWDRPSPAALAEGWKLIQRAQATGAKTPRERGYIEAAAAFYGGDAKTTYEGRCDAYRMAMEKLHEQFPSDHEAAIFYALALVASPKADANDFAYRKQAVTILNAVLKDEPDHPGVAHYLIHACDNPEMAREGLPAARRYAQIAPASAHALHMPSHVFARLGMWQDDIQSNLASVAAAKKQGEVLNLTHALHFLEYAYLQTGQNSKARAAEEEAIAIPMKDYPTSELEYYHFVQVRLPTLFALETRDWKAAERLVPPRGAMPDFQAVVYWAHAVAAGHLRDLPAVQEAVAQYDRALEEVEKSSFAYVAEGMATSRDEAHAWLTFTQGKDGDALGLMSKSADKQDVAGKGEVDLPAREMLADMLRELHRPEEALIQYRRSLETDPNRFNALYGTARSAQAAQKPDLARSYYRRLLANGVDGNRPELAEARSYLQGAQSESAPAH